MDQLNIEIIERSRPVSKFGPHIYREKLSWSAYCPVGDWAYTSCSFPTQAEAEDWLIAEFRLVQAKTPTKGYVQMSLF